MKNTEKIGIGGGCHWCTEGVFESLLGIVKVDQGWISSDGEEATYSEGIIIEFNPNEITLEVLIEIHLYTHSSASLHSMRDKYRSAIYTFSLVQFNAANAAIEKIQQGFDKLIITRVLNFVDFKLNVEEQLNYFYTRPEAPFCKSYIHPKLKILLRDFSIYVDHKKLSKSEGKILIG